MIRLRLSILFVFAVGLYMHSQAQITSDMPHSIVSSELAHSGGDEEKLEEPKSYRSTIFFDALTPYTRYHKIPMQIIVRDTLITA